MKTHPLTRIPFPLALARGLVSALVIAASPTTWASAGASVPQPEPPKITAQPVGGNFSPGQTITLSATATGYPAPNFQWTKNGTNVAGATAAKLVVANAQLADSGSYLVVATNKYGHATSSSVVVTVVPPALPTVAQQPVSQTLNQGQTATFQVAAGGTLAPSYQWRHNGSAIPGATAAALVIPNLQPSDAGSYDALVTTFQGTVLSRSASLNVLIPYTPAPVAPPVAPVVAATRLITQPAHVAVSPGEIAAFTIIAAGESLSFQWKKDGQPLSGATAPAYAIPSTTAADTGFYAVTVTGLGGTVESAVAILTVASASTSRLTNLSTRGYVPAGGALTPGFSWRGGGTKNLLVRAVGPALAPFGVNGTLADPRLEIIPAGDATAVFANDNWNVTPAAAELARASAAAGAFPLPENSRDAALLATLDAAGARNYTARITSTDPAAAGIALAEIYDLDSATAPGRLTAVSTLGYAGKGAQALLPGFTISGAAPKRLLIRAVGPGLRQFGVTDALARPRIAVYAAGLDAEIAANDNWAGDTRVAAAASAVGAFALAPSSPDAALVIALPPGSYTLMVSGADDATGTALVEIYDLDP